MSSFHPTTLTCRCGHARTVELADGLHISARPDLREAILAGSFHAFPCPACGHVTRIEKLLAYTDFPRFHWFTVVPPDQLPDRLGWEHLSQASFRDTMLVRSAPLVKAWAPQMLRRVVFGLAALREKLVALDAGLDDRRLERMKLSLFTEAGLAWHPQTRLHLDRVEDAGLVLAYQPPGQALPVELVLPRATCEQAPADWPWSELTVDWRLAVAQPPPLVALGMPP